VTSIKSLPHIGVEFGAVVDGVILASESSDIVRK
jgi:hypothetical protein